MKSFFGTQYSQEDLQYRLAQRRARNVPARSQSMSILPPGHERQSNEDTMDMNGMLGGMGGESLDDIIMQNNQEIQRRQSLPRGYPTQDIDRRSSMMEFGSNMGDLNSFQFGTSTTPAASDPRMRRQSTSELELGVYSDMSQGMNMPPQQMGYSSLQPQGTLAINTNNQYTPMPGDMMQNMMGFTPMMDGITEEESASMNMNMFSPTSYTNPYGGANMDSMHNDFMMQTHDGLSTPTDNVRPNEAVNNDMMPTMPNLNISEASVVNSPQNMGMNQSMIPFSSPANIPTSLAPRESSYVPPPTPSSNAPDMTVTVKPEPKPQYQGIYSSSGFDMLGALMKVATRTNPEVELGKVDLSCAFVVCDITLYDCPIIYGHL